MHVLSRVLVGVVPLTIALACASADISEVPLVSGALTQKALEGTWLEVSEHEGKPAILKPCDAGVREVRLNGDALVVGWGQEAEDYKVVDAKASGDALELQVTSKHGSSSLPSVITAQRTDRGVLWKISDSTLDTVAESSSMPRFKECCGSLDGDPLPTPTGVVPEDKACP